MCRKPYALANLEAGESFRLLGLDVDPVHTRTPWAVPDERDQPVDRLPLALEDRFDRSVGPVPDPPRDTSGDRAPLRRLAEEDALDVTPHDHTPALHRP